jgi:AGZA family xanthine/uracil permease-like MFS transporter
VLTASLVVRRTPGALLWGILATTCGAWLLGFVQYEGLASVPPSIAPTLFELDIVGAWSPELIPVIFVFFFLALFDSVGTLVAIGTQAGLMRAGVLPRARQALLADAVGTVTGATLGTSTVTAYIESGSGVAAGGRTGLTALVVAALFLLTLFFAPVVRMIGGGYPDGAQTLYPIVAAPLVLVGTMMMAGLREIAWDDPTEAIPAFLTIIAMPLTVSITEGVSFGLIAYVVLKCAAGRAREAHPLIIVFAGLFVLRYALLR